MNPKLNSSVSVVKLSETVLEFFKSNTRQQVRIRVEDDSILSLLESLDGEKSVEQLAEEQKVSLDELNVLFDFLRGKGILDNIDPKEDFSNYSEYRRVIHFLADYSSSHQQLLRMWQHIRNATVLVVGLGAVGAWVACNLVQSGIGKLILMDADTVDVSNLHRQYGYSKSDVGNYKVDALERRLQEYGGRTEIVKAHTFLAEYTLSRFDEERLDLVINCADKPNVDTTSLWIGEYCMKHSIPHIIGGGYNMHLSLIGQTVLPGETACVKCFQKKLEEENRIDPARVKKLSIRNRKVGSFGPMCSLIASMIGMEAIKVLSGCTSPANINRRGEFDIFTMEVKYKPYEKREDCEWCGKNGKYYRT